jgi:hypothetical protein
MFFCNKRDGDSGKPVSAEEQKTLLRLQEMDIQGTIEDYKFEKFQEGLDDGYVSFGKDTIPPRTLDELNFKDPNDPLKETFKELIKTGEKIRPGEGVFGTLYIEL